MDKKKEKQVDNLIEHRKSLWTALIVLNGGIAGLILSFDSPLFCMLNTVKLFLLILGGLLNHSFLTAMLKVNLRLNNLLK